MYCFIYANNINCILNELMLWTEITSEHPIFIITVAKLTNKNLSQDIVNGLMDINKKFSILNDKTNDMKKSIMMNPYTPHMFSRDIRELVSTFLIYDKQVLNFIPEIMQIGKDDKAWQELLEHIDHEQTFMYEAFTNILAQVVWI